MTPRHRNPIRAYRVDRGLSVAALAAAIGAERAELVMVEQGIRLLSESQRQALADRLRVNPVEFDYATAVPGSDRR